MQNEDRVELFNTETKVTFAVHRDCANLAMKANGRPELSDSVTGVEVSNLTFICGTRLQAALDLAIVAGKSHEAFVSAVEEMIDIAITEKAAAVKPIRPQIDDPPQLMPWRVVEAEDQTFEVWTRADDSIGSRNNYAIATGIQFHCEAELIVKCVNQRNELVSALESIRAEANFQEGCDSITLGDIAIACEHIASQALEKVKGVA